jgi:protein-tyrosine phosphatase
MVKPKDGDRILEDHGEKTVVTPLGANNPHNFGPASARDAIVNTCERPGGDTKGRKINTQETVEEWIQFMTVPERNIKHFFMLLTDKELEAYEEPGLLQAYKKGGIKVHHIPYVSEISFKTIMADLDELDEKKEKAVAHCTHGMGRSGRVAAGWLVHRYGLPAEQAVEEALNAAREYGVERMGSPRQLTEWMAES